MDEATLRGYIERHGDAAVRGDTDALAADFSDELRPKLPELVQALPQPITEVEILSVDMGDPSSVAMVRYSGHDSGVTIRQSWQEQGERPVVAHAEPAS